MRLLLLLLLKHSLNLNSQQILHFHINLGLTHQRDDFPFQSFLFDSRIFPMVFGENAFYLL